MIEVPPVIIDTREQRPWVFRHDSVVRCLPAGDYSLEGFEKVLAIERKSLSDFAACCTGERERFERELAKLANYDLAAVIIESDIGDVWARRYRSRVVPQSIVGSAAAFMIDYNVRVFFGGTPAHAGDFAFRLMRKWHERKMAAAPRNDIEEQ